MRGNRWLCRANPNPLPSRRQPQGFTLVEVLVAMTILATTATSLFLALQSGLRFRERARGQLDAWTEIHALMGDLENDLRNLAAVQPNVALEDDSLTLLRTADNRAADAFLQRVRYVWTQDKGDGLVQRSVDDLSVDGVTSIPVEELLARHEDEGAAAPRGWRTSPPGSSARTTYGRIASFDLELSGGEDENGENPKALQVLLVPDQDAVVEEHANPRRIPSPEETSAQPDDAEAPRFATRTTLWIPRARGAAQGDSP